MKVVLVQLLSKVSPHIFRDEFRANYQKCGTEIVSRYPLLIHY